MIIRSMRLAAALTTAAALLLSTAAEAAPQYTVTALGLLPGGHFLDAYAVNDSGSVTGYGYSNGTNLGFLWQGGQLSSLGTLPGAATSGGYDINNSGVIAGSSSGDAFIWQNNQMQLLPRLAGANYASAYAINESGQIVGGSGGMAVVWSNSQVTELPALSGATSSSATGINDKGTIVGHSSLQSYNPIAAMWRNGQVEQLSSGPYRYGGAADVNNADSVAGFVDKGGNLSQAARWDNGQISLLDQLAGINDSRAYAINDSGLVVGSSFATSGSLATLWEGTQALALQDLLINGQGWSLWQAQDINASGQIVGWGMLNGQAQSFLLTPVPEASTTTYMLLGMGVLIAAARRQGRKPS